MNGVLGVLMRTPRNLGVLVLVTYRTVVSPLYGDVCKYYPSCSAYALEAVQRHGLIRGAWLAARRLARCHPWSAGGVDDVPGHWDSPLTTNRFGLVCATAAHTSAAHPSDAIAHVNPERTIAITTGKA